MIAAHADWSRDPRKRWMTRAIRGAQGWRIAAPEPVGPPATLLDRLGPGAVLGLDLPIGLPHAYASTHLQELDFPAFLASLSGQSAFFDVCATLDEIGPHRPFYPARPRKGMTRESHARALGLTGADALNRLCDRATPLRPAGAPIFWTLGANQSGKAAIAAWQELLIPFLPHLALWPFHGEIKALLGGPRTVVAETYPAEAMRQLGLTLHGSKRRHADRLALAPALLDRLGAMATDDLAHAVRTGFGPDAAGEDRLDSVFGVLCVIAVLDGAQPDHIPADPAITRWEGWVLGQAPP